MFRIDGIAKTSGITIAVAAAIDVIRGVNSVDPDILEKGMSSLRRRLPPEDYPEVIIACDSIAVGLSTQLPGLTTVGIAAESDTDAPSLISTVPCVIGLTDLLSSIGPGELIILDGDQGSVFVDPDSSTLTAYQQQMGVYGPQKRIMIDDFTGPAMTSDGKTVLIYSAVSSESQLDKSALHYTDGILMLARSDDYRHYCDLFRVAAGRPTWIIMEKVTPAFLQCVESFAAPGQVTAIFDPPGFDKGLIDITLATAASDGFKTGSYDIPWVCAGITTSGPELMENFEVSHVLLMGGEWEDAVPEISRVSVALHGKASDSVMVYLGSRLDLISMAVRHGFRCIAVDLGLARDAKEQIKSM